MSFKFVKHYLLNVTLCRRSLLEISGYCWRKLGILAYKASEERSRDTLFVLDLH